MANKLIQDLGATAAVLSTDLWEKQPVAGPPSEKATIAQLITLLDTIYTQASGGPYLPLAGGTMVGNILFSADNTRDIGALAATRPRTGYFGTSLITPTVTATTLTGTLSTAAQPNVTSLGTLAASLLFTDNSFDIGASGATRPRTGYWGTSLVSPLLDSPAATALSLASAGTTRANFSTAGHLLFNTDNTNDIGAAGATRPRTGYFGTSVVSPLVNIGSALLTSDAADLLSLRNGTTAQNFRVYNTFTNSTNYELATFGYGIVANRLILGTLKSGTGAARAMTIGTNVNSGPDTNLYIQGSPIEFYHSFSLSWRITTAGNFVCPTDNTYDIGATGATRPRTVYVGTSLVVPSVTMGVAGLLSITSGTNQRAGNATLVGGTITVANTTVTANTVIMLTRKTSGGTIGTAITYTLSAATSFTINSDSVIDTSTFSYLLIEVP